MDELNTRPNLKVRLVDVATQLLVEHRSLKLPTMRQIASSAGVAPGAAYRHFASQEELFISVVSRLFEDLEHALLKAAQESRGNRNIFRSVAQSYVEWGLENPGGYQLMFETTDDDDILSIGERPGLHLLEQLAQLLPDNGSTKPKQVQNVTRLWISLHGLVSLRIHKTGMPWVNSVKQDVDDLIKEFLKP